MHDSCRVMGDMTARWQRPTTDRMTTILTPPDPRCHIGNVDGETGLVGLDVSPYPPRQIILAQAEDVAFLAADTRRGVAATLNNFGRLGLNHIPLDRVHFLPYMAPTSLTEAIRRNMAALVKKKPIDASIEPFIHTPDIDRIANFFKVQTSMPNASIVDLANNKAELGRAMKALNVPFHDGFVATHITAASIKAREILGTHSAVCLKAPRAASGMGVQKARTVTEALRAFRDLQTRFQQEVLIEPWLIEDRRRGCPSVQIHVGPQATDDIVFTATQQILGGEDNKVHLGNINDPTILDDATLMQNIHKVMQWLRSVGYRGIAGIDLFAADGENHYRIGEVNARHTGVTAAMTLVYKLFGKIADVHWAVHNNIPVPKNITPEACLQKLADHQLAFDAKSGVGVIPTNLSAIAHGKIMLVMIGPDDDTVKSLIHRCLTLFT